jgi:alanine racemase
METLPPTRAVIHLDRFRQNIAFVRSLTGKRRILAPVKADAYGHGALTMARAALAAGVDYLGVARVSEAAELRQNGIDAPVMLFSLPAFDEIEAAVGHDVTFFAADAALVDAVERSAARLHKRACVHIKIDTGMGRIGCRPEYAPRLARHIGATKFVTLGGVCTHLAVSDSGGAADIEYTKRQIETFARTIDAIKSAGLDPGIAHAAASGGVLNYPESYFDMVRPGILLYGYPPVMDAAKRTPVSPVMELVTKITFIKRVKKGETVSYGRTWTASRDTTVATLAAGYADGLPRAASGALRFTIDGRHYPQIGRICMDQCMIDLGAHAPARIGDDVTAFGPPETAYSTAGAVADAAGTISYEILCGISKRVPRVYTP